jgi:hypothetical protein
MLYLKSILENEYKIMHPELYNQFINPNSEIFKQLIKNYNNGLNKIIYNNYRIGFSSNFIYEILDAFTYVPQNLTEIKKNDIILVELSKILPNNVPLKIETDFSGYFISLDATPTCTVAVELNNKDYFRNIFNVYKAYSKHGYFNTVDEEKGIYDVIRTNPGSFIGWNSNGGWYDDTISMSPRLKSHGIFFKNGSAEYTDKFTFNSYATNPSIDLTNFSFAINRKNLEKELTMHFKGYKIELDDDNSINNAIKSLKDDFKIDENDLNSSNFNAFYHALLVKFMEAAKEMN